jgi:hypothetical protein
MAVSNGLSAPEALVLKTLPRFDARKAIKIGLFALLLQGVLRMDVEERPRILHKRQIVRLRIVPGSPHPSSPVSRSLVGVVREAGARDGLMAEIVKQARRFYGRTLVKFVQDCVCPALAKQGLAAPRPYRLLGLIPVTRFYPTAAGDTEKKRIDEAMRQASRIPEYLQSDPAQAAAIAAAAGSAILLVDALRPHYQALSRAMRPPSAGDRSGYFDSGSNGCNGDVDLGMPGGADNAFDFGVCDFRAFDNFAAGLDAFDAGFDAACGDGADGGSSGC